MDKLISRYFLTALVICSCLYFLPTLAKHHHRRALHRPIVCLNGTEVAGKCICFSGYIGMHCEKKMYCETFERTANGSCLSCQEGYTGDQCENLICVNGQKHEHEQRCVCDRPYSGIFCDDLNMEDVYLHYNSKMYLIGPLGVLLVIPMILAFYVCEKKAQMRQVKRIERTWAEHQQIQVHTEAVKTLLEENSS